MLDGRLERARALWDEGMSAGLIAKAIGHGCTKSSVVGKAHRQGWPPRPSPIGQYVAEVREAAERVPDKPHHRPSGSGKPRRKPADPYGEKPAAVPCQPLALAVPTATFSRCQWPDGHRGDWRFCEAVVAGAGPYCEEHRTRSRERRPSVRDAWVSAA
jgi:hypothetical protein